MIDELNAIIKELDDDINNFMKPKEKQAVKVIQDIPGIANISAQAIISVLGTNMERFPSNGHLASWVGLCPGDNESYNQLNKDRKTNVYLKKLKALGWEAPVVAS